MTDHEGMIASLNPKLTDKAAIEKRQAELQKNIDDSRATLAIIAVAIPVIAALIAAIVAFGPQIDARRIAL